jgi:Haem-degrading
LLTAYWVDDTAFELAETEVDEGHWSRQNKAWDRYQRQTAKSRIMETITLEETWRVISAAEQKAEEINCPMDIAVVDAGGNLKAHVRMDRAFIGSITISINKAYTAISFQGDEGPGGHEAARAAALQPERCARGKHRHLPRRYPLIARRRDRRQHRRKHRHR